jgi:hypothetical protein
MRSSSSRFCSSVVQPLFGGRPYAAEIESPTIRSADCCAAAAARGDANERGGAREQQG